MLKSVKTFIQPGTGNYLLKRIINSVLNEHSCTLDVGSHKGQVLRWINKSAPEGIHFAFEPIPDLNTMLKRRFYGCHNIRFVEKALADVHEHEPFVYVLSHPSYSGLKERSYPKKVNKLNILVETTTIDDEIPLSLKLDLIKIDVCGGEMQVLQGGIQNIKKNKPVILFRHLQGAADYMAPNPALCMILSPVNWK